MTEENWLLLMDPGWEPEDEGEPPPLRAVVGVWAVEGQGAIGKFQANPDYVPSDGSSPSDPVDAALRLVLRGELPIEQARGVLAEVLVDVAMNGDGRPLVVRSPDDVPCVVVCTGQVHRDRTASPDWWRTGLAGLTGLLGEFDCLINPGGPAAIRLTGDFLREERPEAAELR
ncbi:type VII secretion system-associated protein [Lentzea cavernae]|uniref:Type VII secretion system-associated protein n=1 Tax=Lentzea cavernae TaxID=2020703 RepID=A0ABQ3MPI6_9PSEU|nr:type VII secretion system-associated protein [Lentzea cavernae]GHH56536.1 hypothetical protein GCM10017774_74780 [Lentzea cavernae]